MRKNALTVATGVIIPGLIFLIFIPVLTAEFGIARFGYISLQWILLGVSSVFDLGLGRSITRYISAQQAASDHDPDHISSVIRSILLVGIVWGLCIGVICFPLLYFYGSGIDDPEIAAEFSMSAAIIAVGVPVIVVFNILRGVTEGWQDFFAGALAKITNGVGAVTLLTFSSFVGPTLTMAAICLVAARLAGLMVLVFATRNRFCWMGGMASIPEVRPLVVFGWWASLSAMCSSVLSYLDRFVFGYFLPPNIFGSYSIIADVMMRLLFIPSAISTALFPTLNSNENIQIREKMRLSHIYVAIALLPLLMAAVMFGEHALELWVPGRLSGVPVQTLIIMFSIGVMLNALAQVSLAVVHARGAAKFTARLHAAELALFLPLLVFAVQAGGLVGGVSVWIGRVAVDLLMLERCARKLTSQQPAN